MKSDFEYTIPKNKKHNTNPKDMIIGRIDLNSYAKAGIAIIIGIKKYCVKRVIEANRGAYI